MREDFLEFVPVYDCTGENLSHVIEERLLHLGFDLTKLRGQGYDGASAMRGEFRGVQARLLEKYPKALYTHCVAHNLNLCLSDATKVRQIQNSTGLMKEVCSYFKCSAKRTKVLNDNIKELTPEKSHTRLQSLCETRWCERHEAVLLFKDSIVPVFASLQDIDDKQAAILLKAFDFCFLISVFALSKILGITYLLSVRLQAKDQDLVSALAFVKETRQVLKDIRKNADQEFHSLYLEASEMAADLGIPSDSRSIVPRLTKLQKHRANVPFQNPEQYYRTTIFIPFVDDIISALSERFLAHESTISSLQYIMPKNCSVPFEKVEPSFEFYSADLPTNSQEAFKGEWLLWQQKWKNVSKKPSTAIEVLQQASANFPCISVLAEIMVVLPVTTASVERSFSSLRYLKNYLRNSIGQNRLTSLALMAIHRDIAITVQSSEIVDDFALTINIRLNFKI